MTKTSDVQVLACAMTKGARIDRHEKDENGRVVFYIREMEDHEYRKVRDDFLNGLLSVDAKKLFISQKNIGRILKNYAKKKEEKPLA